jgi:hypothetical protein
MGEGSETSKQDRFEAARESEWRERVRSVETPDLYYASY